MRSLPKDQGTVLVHLRMIVIERDYSRTEFLRAVSFLLRAPCLLLRAPCSLLRAPCSVLRTPCSASFFEHLPHHFDVLPILRPVRRFFRANDVFQSRGEERVTVHLEPYGVRRQIGESGRPRGVEREIQASGLRDQVPDLGARASADCIRTASLPGSARCKCARPARGARPLGVPGCSSPAPG